MGAIFALFAGFYYWYPIITTYNYNEIWALTHFYLLFIGVKRLAQIEYLFKIILFDTRKSYHFYGKDNNSKISSFFYWFLNINKNILLTKYYPIAQLVEVNHSMDKASQRLNTKDIFWLIGFIDGDGCLTYYKDKKYQNNWRHELSIGLSIKDIRLLYYIKKLLNCGTVYKYNNVAIYRIKKITHLLNIIIPIFDNYPLLTSVKRINYLKFRETLLNKVINSKLSSIKDKELANYLLSNTNKVNNLYNMDIDNLLSNLESKFIKNWIIGFTEAEGSFYFVKLKEGGLRPEFRISQNNNIQLLNKIKSTIKLNRKVSLQSNSNIHYYLISVAKEDIIKVIDFYTDKDLTKFKGIKLLSFQLWLKGIKNIHHDFNIPNY